VAAGCTSCHPTNVYHHHHHHHRHHHHLLYRALTLLVVNRNSIRHRYRFTSEYRNLQSIIHRSSAIPRRPLQYHKTTKSTRSSAYHFLSVLRHNLSFGSRAFRISAPKIWNSLPPHILQSQTLGSFRRHLKTYYFQSAYPAP